MQAREASWGIEWSQGVRSPSESMKQTEEVAAAQQSLKRPSLTDFSLML